VAIGTDSSTSNTYTVSGEDFYGLYMDGRTLGINFGNIELLNFSSLVISNDGGIGVGTTLNRAIIDFADAGKSVDTIAGAFMLPPRLSNSQRVGLATEEGGLIYNITSKRLELYLGTGRGWVGIATVL
jgi:hypothetical protein